MIRAWAPALMWAAVVLAVDPGAYYGGHSPKQIGLIALMAVGLATLTGASLLRRSGASVRFTVVEVLILIRMVWLAATHPDPLEYLASERFWVLASLLALCLWTRNTPESVGIWLRGLAGMALLQALLGIAQHIGGTQGLAAIKTNVIGTVIAPNGFGLLMAVGIIAWLSVARRMVAIPVSAILLAALVLNGSRGAVLALVGVAAVAIWLRWPTWRTAALTAPVLALAVVVAAGLNTGSTSGRWMIWRVSTQMAFDHASFGVGHGRFGVEYLPAQAAWLAGAPDLAHKAAHIRQAHNEHLQAFVEGGVPGGLLFAAVWLAVGLRLRRNASAAIVGLVWLHGLVDSPLHVLPTAMLAYGLIPASACWPEWVARLPAARLTPVVLGVATVALVAVPFRQGQRYAGYRYWQQGQDHAAVWNWSEALVAYGKALDRLPSQGELHFHVGAALVHDGNPADGLRYLDLAKRRFADRNIWLSAAHAHLMMGDTVAAEREALTARDMFPDHLAPYLLLARIWHRQGRHQLALEAIERCMQQRTRIRSRETEQIALEAAALQHLVGLGGHLPHAPDIGR